MPGRRQSAYIKATQEAQSNSNTVKPSQGEDVSQVGRDTATQPQGESVIPPEGVTVPQQDSKAVAASHSATVKKDKKVTFYLTQDEEDKLQDLEYELWKRYKKRINRNDIVRYLIDQVTADNLQDLA